MERVKIKVSASFWLFVAVAVIFRQSYFALLYTVAVLLHEVSHYVVASRLFYRCTQIRLGIFGATLYGDFDNVSSVDRIKIALAGPLCNAVLCLVCVAVWWIVPSSYYFTEQFFSANASMCCANLLPCYPLDGGRIVTGIAESKWNVNGIKFVKNLTIILSVGLFAVFVVSLVTADNLFAVGLFAVCLFSGVLVGNGGECYVKTTFASNIRYFKKFGMEKKTLVFYGSSKLRDVAKRMQGNFAYCLEVVNDNLEVVANYSVAELERLVLDNLQDTKLIDLVQNK